MERSKCCHAPVVVNGNTTMYSICTACECATDYYFDEKEYFRDENGSYLTPMENFRKKIIKNSSR